MYRLFHKQLEVKIGFTMTGGDGISYIISSLFPPSSLFCAGRIAAHTVQEDNLLLFHNQYYHDQTFMPDFFGCTFIRCYP